MNKVVHDSPVGRLTLVSDGAHLVVCAFDGSTPPREVNEAVPQDDAVLREAMRQLDDYFADARRAFDLPLAARGTAFQRRVWQELGRIPFGETRSYGEVAERLGNPKAMRAVGAANGRNPIAIIVPCHRVIGASGALTGFGGGLARKAYLLELERSQRALFQRR
jgi:methylated-DNA-[protein]-cysteine S-methyltransferase